MAASASVGAMRHQVTLQSPLTTDDGSGGRSVTWQTAAVDWAEITALSGDERFLAGAETATVNYRLRLRWRSDVTPQWRALLSDGRVLDITAAYDAQGDRRWLTLDAQQGPPA